MTIGTADILAGFAIGLAGTGHCLGMCGGIVAALSLGTHKIQHTQWAYQCGRITSYVALGALFGVLAGGIAIAEWALALRYLAGALMVAMGLALAELWRGVFVLERGGAFLWNPIRKLSSGLLPIRSAWQSFALGACWGLMPCGLIYSALAWSATSQSASGGAALMGAFGLGTLPAMLATSFGASSVHALLRHRGIKLFTAWFLIGCGVWTLGITSMHSSHLLQHPDTSLSAPQDPHFQHNQHHHLHGH
ncbi:MAG: sulfite exporter TauE/SafE family protein [Pseudomonadota bacterium]